MKKNIITILMLILIIFLIIEYYYYLNKNKTWPKHEHETNDFLSIDNSFVKKQTLSKNIKYIMYECVYKHCSGWADRVKGIMTTYALSLIMNRKFIIKMTKPCNLEDYLLPNEIDWRPNITNYNKLSKRYLAINWRGQMNSSSFSKINFLNYDSKTDIIITTINMQLIKHLTVNKIHHKRIKQLGYSIQNFTIENLISTWYDKLFKFNDELNLKFTNLMKKLKPNNETKLICTQIRIFSYNERKYVNSFWKFIQNRFISNLSDSNYKLFVTSDRPDIIDESKKIFGAEYVIGSKKNSFHINYANGNNKEKCDNIMQFIIDFKILGMCDMGVVSHSGFGMIGILNREVKDYSNFYVLSNPEQMRKQFWNRNNLTFVPFDPSLFYLEFQNGII